MIRLRTLRWCALASAGGTLWAAGGCLPENFYATLLGDTVVTGTVSALLTAALAAIGLA